MSFRHSHHPSQSVFLWGGGDWLSPTELLAWLRQYHQIVGLEVDHFSLGGTVRLLEEKMASILGKESAYYPNLFTQNYFFCLQTLQHSGHCQKSLPHTFEPTQRYTGSISHDRWAYMAKENC